MSEKFPPRVGIYWHMNKPILQWTNAKADEPFDSDNLVLPFISLREHESRISQLEERLREIEVKHQHIVMASKQVFKWFTPTDPDHPVGKLKTAVEELAAIKEKK